MGDHLSSWQGCVSHRPSAAQRGLACAASAGIACVHRDAGHRVGWRARATRFESGVAQRRQAQAGSRRSVAAILELTFFLACSLLSLNSVVLKGPVLLINKTSCEMCFTTKTPL